MQLNPAQETDKGYLLMEAIESDRDLSQRELSIRTGLSLGSVNLLLQKMIREGLVKMETIPSSRVIYMLTPQGLAEKARKTVQYIRNHYRIIEENKALIRRQLERFHRQYSEILICLPGNELDNLVETAVSTYLAEHPKRVVHILDNLDDFKPAALNAGEQRIILYLPSEAADGSPQHMTGTSIPQASLLDQTL